MSSENLKKLTGKNPKDFEPVACSLINNSDTVLFGELVLQEDFLFDFVKQNVSDRLAKVCNKKNYLNLLNFLKYYSPSYEEFIVSTLARYADEDLTDKMLDIFENGTDEEKTYCAKFFSYIQDPLALDYLKQYSFSENSALSANCAATLAAMGDKTSYNEALEKLNSSDDFEKLDAVKFLVSYGNKDAVPQILELMKKSAFAENIAGELIYLDDIFSIIQNNKQNGLFVLNCLINGLGEILGLCQVFDFRMYDIFQQLLKEPQTSQSAVVLMNAKDKFNTLTENDEYLFDESKDVKQEVLDIKHLLSSVDESNLQKLADNEINEDSLFVYTALDFTSSADKVRDLLNSSNQTLILKAIEVLKFKNLLEDTDKNVALNSVTDENIKSIITAI